MAIPTPTSDQLQRLVDDHAAHRTWMRENKSNEHPYPLAEEPFTGLILAGLLDPESAASVYRALLAGPDP